jgi:hypothetical protein
MLSYSVGEQGHPFHSTAWPEQETRTQPSRPEKEHCTLPSWPEQETDGRFLKDR